MPYPDKFRFSIDRGGTFTDVYAEVPGEPSFRIVKLLSEDPEHYDDAPLEGIRRIFEEVEGSPISAGQVDTKRIEWIRMGTTVATNALLERQGARTALFITKGFGDLLQIGYQNRPNIFDLEIKKPEQLYEHVVEVDERVRLLDKDEQPTGDSIVKGVTGEYLEILKKPDLTTIHQELQRLKADGITSIAVVCMHSYTFPDHEQQIGELARELGFSQISLSSAVMPMVKIVARGDTCVVDAYLTPHIRQSIDTFRAGFSDDLDANNLLFMRSDGGLTSAENFHGSKAILSGPAGGVVGCAMTGFAPNQSSKRPQGAAGKRTEGETPDTRKRSVRYTSSPVCGQTDDRKASLRDSEVDAVHCGRLQAIIGFDMGGTSTDVCRYDGAYEMVHETETAGVRIQAPQLDIITVAAGGGSRLFFKNGMFQVGPESAGAHPGPVCYRKNGYLAVTDANLVLGRLVPEFFPNIFGPHCDQPLDISAANKAFEELRTVVNKHRAGQNQAQKSLEEMALGFIQVANETMIRPMREISVAKGYDIQNHVLVCFGGAGGQHACAIARRLGVKKIRIHRFAGILSAYGMGLADVVEERQEPAAEIWKEENTNEILKRLEALGLEAEEALQKQGFTSDKISIQPYLNLRYHGTDTALMIERPVDDDFAGAFRDRHFREFGFNLQNRALHVDNVRIRAVGHAGHVDTIPLPAKDEKTPPISTSSCYFESGWFETPVFIMTDLGAGESITGPAILIHDTSTIVVEPHCIANITTAGDIEITLLEMSSKSISTTCDPVQLAIFSNLFMSVAEQMGRTLQRTAISTNIKERLDFSCALFDGNGGLVANAPHQPVHLGAMSEAVRQQVALASDTLQDGDVLVTNHPQAGGSHLPDITVITPFFQDGKPAFFVANRGHHADIGGITPGSMPPFSTHLDEEGACIKTFKLVENGLFQEEGVAHLLQGSRALADNLSDLKAQVAANNKGIGLLQEIIQRSSFEVVQAYMDHIQSNAENAVRYLLEEFAETTGQTTLQAVDHLDDGSAIALKVSIDPEQGTAVFDFSGTGKQLEGNLNAPRAVSQSAILYGLRCLIKQDIPLNQGCLAPISVIIPDGSLLAPSEDAAVVGGNVLTSQRVVDVILKAFGAAAASQGCMNNFTFGNETFGYYETIGGGAGAGPTWHGQSGVHTHMTNTRITDPEILERRYPVLLHEFAIRRNSGGKGQFAGGDGLVREIEFLAPLSAAILSERRTIAPYGLAGGEDGEKGRNLHIHVDGNIDDLGGKNHVHIEPGDRIRIETPGGGGYGPGDTSSD